MNSTFEIYSASAGSGKTYTLAKSYIKLLISSKNNEHFKSILAITFTNKAVGEMKTRIIEMLKAFSAHDYSNNTNSMFQDICNELSISKEELHSKSKIVLHKIIHNYGAFDISTIDGFTHRVIRTFAFDLKLPVNFEVELDQDYLLTKAVDGLISKAGTDKNLTKTLIDFALEKADDDKSWDISYDFKKISKLLLSENDIPYINQLKEKTLGDFRVLKTQLIKTITELESQIVEKAKTTLDLIYEAGLEFDDFNRKSLPNHFLSLTQEKFNLKFDSAWQIALLEGSTLYPKRVSDNVVEIITNIQPTLAEAFTKTKEWLFELKFNKAVYKNITPLSVINALQKELKTLKEEENKILISEFNSLISNEIKNQPTPFIYERLGEKFRHYFVDEFQDTSIMQWENLVPLMDNALSSNDGSAMLVGDAKQSIYRWRGGDAEQFINLYKGIGNPFQTVAQVKSLDTNFRSYKAVVDFNNSFFGFVSDTFFSDDDFKELYKDAKQNISIENGGFVNLLFLEFDNPEERSEQYVEKTYEIIKSSLEKGYKLKDICVLVRKKKEGVAISNYLTSQKIDIVSSETLLLQNSPKVRLLNLMLALLINPEDKKLKLDALISISDIFHIENKHSFFSTHIQYSAAELLDRLKEIGIHLNFKELIQMPIYEAAESLVRGLKLCETTSDAYVQFYLDTVLDYSNKQTPDIMGFLEYFDSKKETLSIAMPNNLDAVSIMTIHKSKGLEFPVVIFPFADLDIYKEFEPKEWFPLDENSYSGFNHALINYSKDFENYGDIGEVIYNKHQSQIELDGINLLYVNLTRAIEQLYIVSKKDISSKGVINEKTYAGLFINYLIQQNLWTENQLSYAFGEPKKQIEDTPTENPLVDYQFISTNKESHNLRVITNAGVLWETEQEKAINYGNIIHLVMSKIKTKHDAEFAIKSVLSDGYIQQSDTKQLKNIVTQIIEHKELEQYFSEDYDILNEKDIITKEGSFLRPDRLAIKDKNVVIIDYKTGGEDKKHKAQLESYANVLREMNYNIEKKMIVYTNDDIKIIEVK
ncbi:UvrD-helicase domain-containing protein [Winogradskyella jejuensis]|uniref:DNA 3'-5' helicase n=1 Tax=Winogradskyella jejuensis TaxID=1089305 RepID=A0A1M5N8Z4_9FLAO|nr:UvrD-helicase domain-containing protein [Winogradskyella jejuensis]SHG85649.1 ATP-dependent exoDNAse (exonuclease V) beta subunit (contains helicase and exonuclease domains) [Winogradskyella jejuensis]